MKRNKKGFTLTELIIVIVIIGILAAVLIPSISGYIKKAKVSKGVQNARNITSLVIGEVLFNDEEFLMPNDVIAVANKGGYDLVSELEDYAYWYDTATNTIHYEKIEETILGTVEAATTEGRSRIESLSPAYPKWFYIDQTENVIHQAIVKINNLVELGKQDASGSTDKSLILNAMDAIVSSLASDINGTKFIKGSAKEEIKQFVSTFNTTDTLYYSEEGIFNKQLLDNASGTADVTIERAIVIDGTVTIKPEGDYDSVYITLNSPLIVPGTVKDFPDGAVKAIQSGYVYISSNSAIDVSKFNSTVSVGSIADLNIIPYTYLSVKPNYANKEYRFRNGVTFTVPSDIELVLDSSNILVKVSATGEPSYFDTADSKYLCIDGTYIEKVIELSSQNYQDMKKRFLDNILSIYLIPTVEVKDISQGGNIDITKFISLDRTSTRGTISLRSTVEPFSVKYSAVMVDAENIGYKIDNVGYISDVVVNVSQMKSVLDEEGKVISYTIDGNDSAKIELFFPKDAQTFSNFKNITVKVEYICEAVEYEDFQIMGMAKPIRIPTGNSIKDTEVRSIVLEGDLNNGYHYNLNSLPTFNEIKSNQINIKRIIIVDNNGKELLVRYY